MQSGKSTVAEYLKHSIEYELNMWACMIGFADGIKECAIDLFNDCQWLNLNDQSVKNSSHKSGKTYRKILQELGAKMREIWPDIWVDMLNKSLVKTGINIVPDVRFPNEVKAIQEMGGIVIRLTRDPVGSMEETETALDIDGNYYTGFKNAN